MTPFWLTVLFSIITIGYVAANGPTLVLLDHLSIKETHSIFFKALQGMTRCFLGVITADTIQLTFRSRI